jgi:hypothetical protein
MRLRRRNLKITTRNSLQPEHDSRIADAPVMRQGLLNGELVVSGSGPFLAGLLKVFHLLALLGWF